ncbi:MAG: 5-formyltetrahydrofolate cyclo-ligase [Tissierellia bacterium]|nr:5-formyltetrahydrofolate cyclo-ligase [Tissierellia bacterium]
MDKSYNSVTKEELRKVFLALRREKYENNQNDLEKTLLQQEYFLQLLPKSSKRIFIYWSMKYEFPTQFLIRYFLENNFKVYLPKIIGKNMLPAPIKNMKDVTPGPGPFYIPEPTSKEVTEKMDLILVPGLAFDLLGGRLGYGGGYYDRYLKKFPPKSCYGLAFDFQIIPQVPMKDYDVYLDGIITSSKVYHKKSCL